MVLHPYVSQVDGGGDKLARIDRIFELMTTSGELNDDTQLG